MSYSETNVDCPGWIETRRALQAQREKNAELIEALKLARTYVVNYSIRPESKQVGNVIKDIQQINAALNR